MQIKRNKKKSRGINIELSGKDIAKAMGIDVSAMDNEAGSNAAIEAIKVLSKSVNIPAGLKELGVKEEDLGILATNALKDACGATNPIQGSHEDIVNIYRSAL
jgi:alcohol dehydrogenase